ncbi:hypothetical protein ACHAWF_013078, partial [Thalassiosira exigua]
SAGGGGLPPPRPPSPRPLPPSPTAAAASGDGDDDGVPPPPSTPSSLARERQTLLLTLLGQVCSLHDATPRTFVVYVLALYERGILDASSIGFLFELGLVPRGYGLDRIGNGTDCGEDGGEVRDVPGGDGFGGSCCGCDGNPAVEDGDPKPGSSCAANSAATESRRADESWEELKPSRDDGIPSRLPMDLSEEEVRMSGAFIALVAARHGKERPSETMGAIVPYCGDSRHPWAQFLPTQTSTIEKSSSSNNDSTDETSTQQSTHNLHSKKMAIRQREASAIRKHLERHESIESSTRGSAFASLDAQPSWPSSATSESNGRNRADSAEQSFHNPSLRPQREAQSLSSQLAMPPPPTSWSPEHHPLSLSRYQREFHQSTLLASGSFGSVFRAIHKLERKPYAIKRVTFSTKGFYADALALVVREVRCLAQLDNPNCVRYYASWLEPSWMTGERREVVAEEDSERGNGGQTFFSRSEDGRDRPKLLTDVERVVEGLRRGGAEGIDASVERLEAILYGSDGSEVDDGFNWTGSSRAHRSAFSFDPTRQTEGASDRWSHLPSHRTNDRSLATAGDGGDSDVSEWTQDLSEGYSNRAMERQGSHELVPAGSGSDTNKRRRQYQKQSSSAYEYQISLYIQMQLCDPSTLADWIRQRNRGCVTFDADERHARARPAFEVFRQIVNGLAHVHSKRIIHRDLKPANIFAGDNGSFMIGDFGLSKMMRDVQRGVDTDPNTYDVFLPGVFGNEAHTVGVGTASYASPEQIASKSYGTAADIFSLGLILLELFSNFTSEHERGKAFHDCRNNRELAPSMRRYYPEIFTLILACTQADWSQRPSASDILAASVFQDRSNGAEIFHAEVRALRVELTRKDEQIQRQQQQIEAKDATIQNLKLRLAALDAGGHVRGGEIPIGVEDSSSCSSDGDY